MVSYMLAGNTEGGTITVLLTSCLTGFESAVWQLTIFAFICKNRLIETSQTGGQRYSDTSPFSIPFMLGLNWEDLKYFSNSFLQLDSGRDLDKVSAVEFFVTELATFSVKAYG